MKQVLWITVMAAVIVTLGCDAARNEKPLLLDGSEPLFLLDQGNPKLANLPPPKGPVADNSRCFVCHMNYHQEELAVIHARHNISCETCHGPCDAHCNDEDNITPPTIMFPRAIIPPACMKCHPAETLCDKEHHWDVFAPTTTAKTPKKICTDCHGKHRLARRTSQWDKKTGKLLLGGWHDQK